MARRKRKRPHALSWREFRALYEREVMSQFAPRTQDEWFRIAAEFELAAKPRVVDDLDGDSLCKYVDRLAHRGLSPKSMTAYVALLKSAATWAYNEGLIPERVKWKDRRLTATGTSDKSRGLTEAEHQQLIAAVPIVRQRNEDAPVWVRLLNAMRRCDLRVSELLGLSWEPEAKVRLVTAATGQMLIHFPYKRSQKGYKPGLHPITKEFADMCLVDEYGEPSEQEGFIFPMYGREHPHNQRKRTDVNTVVRRLAEYTGIITCVESGKLANCHDIGRRSYINWLVWEKKVTPIELAHLVRHADSKVTEKYYVAANNHQLGKDYLGWND